MTAEQIKSLIEQALPGARVEVGSPDGTHFEALVVHDGFAGRSVLERHRMVYASLGERMGGDIHALSLRTITPDEQ